MTSPRAATPHILIVEDDAALADYLFEALTGRGYSAEIACNGREGLDAARRRTPQLMILDLSMPIMDGFEVLDARQDDMVLSQVPVLVASARHMRADVSKAKALGASGYLAKPFNPSELLRRVAAQLQPAILATPASRPDGGAWDRSPL